MELNRPSLSPTAMPGVFLRHAALARNRHRRPPPRTDSHGPPFMWPRGVSPARVPGITWWRLRTGAPLRISCRRRREALSLTAYIEGYIPVPSRSCLALVMGAKAVESQHHSGRRRPFSGIDISIRGRYSAAELIRNALGIRPRHPIFDDAFGLQPGSGHSVCRLARSEAGATRRDLRGAVAA